MPRFRLTLLCAASILCMGGIRCVTSAPSVAPQNKGEKSASLERAEASRSELKSEVVDVEGHPITVWSKIPEGKTKGSFLLIHGLTWSALPDFDLQVDGEELSLMDALVERGYASFAVDLRGYGVTPRDPSGWLSPDRAAKDLIHILEWMNAEGEKRGEARPKIIVFGWSRGAMLAHLVAQRRPDLMSQLILFGHPARFKRWKEAGAGGQSSRPDPAPSIPNTAEAAASDFITKGSISQAAIDSYVSAALRADPIRVNWTSREQWKELEPGLVTVPTLLMQGEYDPIAPTQRQQQLFVELGTSDKEWVMIPGGDHAAFLEKSRAYFLSALIAFVERPRSEGSREMKPGGVP